MSYQVHVCTSGSGGFLEIEGRDLAENICRALRSVMSQGTVKLFDAIKGAELMQEETVSARTRFQRPALEIVVSDIKDIKPSLHNPIF